MDVRNIAQKLVESLMREKHRCQGRIEGVEMLYEAIAEEAKREEASGQDHKPDGEA